MYSDLQFNKDLFTIFSFDLYNPEMPVLAYQEEEWKGEGDTTFPCHAGRVWEGRDLHSSLPIPASGLLPPVPPPGSEKTGYILVPVPQLKQKEHSLWSETDVGLG